nr:hypothetical protein B0A51_10802 [Rachicladosporium sp. CCFEE 5018]
MSKLKVRLPLGQDEASIPVRAIKIFGLTATAFLAGKTFNSSYSTTPALLLAPAPLLAKQWKKQFDVDHNLVVGLAFSSVPVLGFLAYRAPPPSLVRKLYALATVLLASVVPYSALLMMPITQQLAQKARTLASASLTDTDAEVGVSQEDSVHQLVDRWAIRNLGRSVLIGLSALVAAWAASE